MDASSPSLETGDTAPHAARFPLTAEIIAAHATALGPDFTAYRNHVCRVLEFHLALSGETMPSTAVSIAAAFHDLGIRTAQTFDYLEPSAALAAAYLERHGLAALEPEVRALIVEHHKLTRYTGPHAASVETWRRADLIDVSLGTLRHGLPRAFVRTVLRTHPNAGFHRLLAKLSAKQFLRTPWRPLPMIHL
jgi:hypothetical protein